MITLISVRHVIVLISLYGWSCYDRDQRFSYVDRHSLNCTLDRRYALLTLIGRYVGGGGRGLRAALRDLRKMRRLCIKTQQFKLTKLNSRKTGFWRGGGARSRRTDK